MHSLTIFIYFISIIRVSQCCIPNLSRPEGGNGNTGNGSPGNVSVTTTSTEESTRATTIEKAKTTFDIVHESRSYFCTFEFSFQFKDGINIMDEAPSKCLKTAKGTDSAVKFLEKHDFLVPTTRNFDISCNIYIVFEENDDQISLSDTVILQSMNCSPVPGQCLTEDGPDYPNTCTFPFIYQDRIYQACTDWKDGVQGDRLWCATQTMADETMVAEKWSWCNDFCGYCGGKDLKNISATQTEAYGECKTLKGGNCIFPFKDGTKEYSECAQFRDIYHWCAITTDTDGNYLKWDKCDPETCPLEGAGTCKTISGPDPHKPCIFPFKDGSKEYTSCAPWRSQFWCATAVSTDGSYTSYGYCASDGTCPLSKTRKTVKTTKSDLSCGYNCFINLNKKMVSFTPGVSQDVLLPPTSIIWDLSEREWNILPKGKYQFLIGQKGIDLKCPDGTTFSKFSEESWIHVKCTGEYSFTVEGQTTGQVWKGEKNVNFGCNPCPINYRAVTGYISAAYGLALHFSIISLSSCEELCENMKKCQIFQYSNIYKQCSLHEGDAKIESALEAGYQVCKSEKHKCATPLKSFAIRSPDQDSIREGETVTYKCIDSTEMIGDPSNTCTKTGFVKPLPTCAVCCNSIVLKYELGAAHLDDSGYYDSYDLQSDLKNGHVWYKSKSGNFVFWKSSISGKKIWALGELASEKIVAKLEADGCPYDPQNVDKWEFIAGKMKHSGNHRGDFTATLMGNCDFQISEFLEIFTIPVGQGECTLIKCPYSDEHILVDMGSVKKGQDTTSKLASSFLEYLGNDGFTQKYHVSNIFLTHPDKDHISHVLPFLTGLRSILPNGPEIHIYFGGEEKVWEYGSTYAKALWKHCKLDKKIMPHYVTIMPTMATYPISLCNDNAEMRILVGGMGGYGKKNNEQSLVMKLVSKTSGKLSSMLFMGDFEGEDNYKNLISKKWSELYLKGRNSVMTVPHHGSRTVTDHKDYEKEDTLMREFYSYVNPRFAIVSSHIEHSRFHHPQVSTLNNICFTSQDTGGLNSNTNLNAKNGQGWSETGGWRLKYGTCDPGVTRIFQTSVRNDNDNGNTFYLIKTTIDWNGDQDRIKIEPKVWIELEELEIVNIDDDDGEVD